MVGHQTFPSPHDLMAPLWNPVCQSGRPHVFTTDQEQSHVASFYTVSPLLARFRLWGRFLPELFPEIDDRFDFADRGGLVCRPFEQRLGKEIAHLIGPMEEDLLDMSPCIDVFARRASTSKFKNRGFLSWLSFES